MSLEGFHPACRRWFEAQFTAPTPAQADAWAAIRRGSHTLIAAPTGSGKTLAAFYAGLDRLVSQGDELSSGVQILYVSPLKALNNDIHRNLQIPLAGIAELREDAAPEIRIAVRTGDTPAAERRKMAAHPPHILVTTPESLYLLLTSASGRAMLASVSTLIVDEIHAMLGDKRGSHLALSIERLEDLAGLAGGPPLQRIGLSATQKPVETVAQFLTGANATTGPSAGDGAQTDNSVVRKFDCEIIDAGFRRNMELSVEVPGSPLSAVMSAEVWEELYQRLVELILAHNTTLVFVNTRRLSERLALALGERLGEGVVSAHHGSMSRDHRFTAEQQLKSGQLKSACRHRIDGTGHRYRPCRSLVVQFSSPKSIAAFLQRVGRSGHSIDGHAERHSVSPEPGRPRGSGGLAGRDSGWTTRPHPRTGQTARYSRPADNRPKPPCATKDGNSTNCSPCCGRAWPYRNLERAEFDDVITMLAEGLYDPARQTRRAVASRRYQRPRPGAARRQPDSADQWRGRFPTCSTTRSCSIPRTWSSGP